MTRNVSLNKKLVLFDIDGTLARGTTALHLNAMMSASNKVHGVEIPYSLDGHHSTVAGQIIQGMVDAQIIRLGLSAAGLDKSAINGSIGRIVDLMVELYENAVDEGQHVGEVIPGVAPAIRDLERHSASLGLLTGNAERLARKKMGALGLLEFLPVGGFGDFAFERAELFPQAISAARAHFDIDFHDRDVLYVGDTPRDVIAARTAGVKVVAVSTGRYSYDELAMEQPDLVLTRLGPESTTLFGALFAQ